MKQVKWQGVYPAVTTRFDANGELDVPGFLENIYKQLEAGVDGIIVGGSLGESSTLEDNERLLLVKEVLNAFGNRTDVIMNISESSTRRAAKLGRAAEEIGAHGIMLLPPMMYKSTERELIEYFGSVAKSTSLPIMLYNNPVDYKTEVTLDALDALSGYANIQAIKESTRDVSNVTRIRNRFGDRYRILCGVDTLAMEELLMGADGWVAGLVDAFPAETVAVYRLTRAGRIEEARKIYRWFLPILELDIHPQLVQNIKLAESMTGMGTEYVRAPRLMLAGSERERVKAIVEKGLANRPVLPDYLKL